MGITVYLKDKTTVVASGPVLDVIHSPSDPNMIILTNAGVASYWFDASNFEYAVVTA